MGNKVTQSVVEHEEIKYICAPLIKTSFYQRKALMINYFLSVQKLIANHIRKDADRMR